MCSDVNIMISIIYLHAGNNSPGGYNCTPVRIRILLDLVSYADVRVQSNLFILEETSCYGRDMKDAGAGLGASQ